MIDYLPLFLRDIREYIRITEIEQPEFEEGWAQAEYALQEAFLMTATDYGLSRWEGMMGVTPKGTETIEERRFRILSLLASDTPYTYRQLEKLLTSLCGKGGYEIELDHNNYSILVKVALTSRSSYEAVIELLAKIIPANLIFNAILKYNQHSTLSKYTHAQLRAYTQFQLRDKEGI